MLLPLSAQPSTMQQAEQIAPPLKALTFRSWVTFLGLGAPSLRRCPDVLQLTLSSESRLSSLLGGCCPRLGEPSSRGQPRRFPGLGR
jgi:hypothetical protein